jgi:hypothetical protein
MSNEERAYRIVRAVRELMRNEGVDPNLNDVAAFYHARPDIQRRVAAGLK